MDKLTATRGCPGLSYLNTCERAMSILNIGFSALSLTLDPHCDQWLIEEVLAGATSMKSVQKNIEDYDKEFCMALSTIERRLKQANTMNTSDDLDDVSNGQSKECNYLLKIGETINAFIDYHIWHVGTVTSIEEDEASMDIYTIKFEKNYKEEWSSLEVENRMAEKNIPVGGIGYKFIKSFPMNGGQQQFFNGKVRKIRGGEIEKRECVFCDGEVKQYKLEQLVEFSNNKVNFDVEDDTESESDTTDDGTDDEDVNGENMNNDDEVQVISSGRFYTKLCAAPVGTTLMERFTNLKNRVSANEAFKSAMEHPKKMIENRFRQLELEGRKVEVLNYASKNDVALFEEKLKSFDKNYDKSVRSKSQLQKMKLIAQFLNCEKHCRITPWSLEYRLCGKVGCEICIGIGRGVRAPDITIGGKNVRQEILSWLVLPVLNEDHTHYLSTAVIRDTS